MRTDLATLVAALGLAGATVAAAASTAIPNAGGASAPSTVSAGTSVGVSSSGGTSGHSAGGGGARAGGSSSGGRGGYAGHGSYTGRWSYAGHGVYGAHGRYSVVGYGLSDPGRSGAGPQSERGGFSPGPHMGSAATATRVTERLRPRPGPPPRRERRSVYQPYGVDYSQAHCAARFTDCMPLHMLEPSFCGEPRFLEKQGLWYELFCMPPANKTKVRPADLK